jgi:hypothetical protein
MDTISQMQIIENFVDQSLGGSFMDEGLDE